jgi:5-methylcytosine-specific restriction endonuclease McrA
MEAIGGLRTLVLNADYRPLNYFPLSVCSWQDAIKDIFLNRVHVISEYESSVRSVSTEIKIPSVVCLKRYIKSKRDIPTVTRSNLLIRDRFECQYCGEDMESRRLTMDHVIPRSKGGRTLWNNLVAACNACNSQKGDKIPGKNFPHPLHRPWTPTNADLQKISRELSLGNIHESWADYLN